MQTPLIDGDESRRHLDEYALIYDDGRETEYVMAYTPAEAVINRVQGYGSLLPHTIVNITLMQAWREQIDANKEAALWLR